MTKRLPDGRKTATLTRRNRCVWMNSAPCCPPAGGCWTCAAGQDTRASGCAGEGSSPWGWTSAVRALPSPERKIRTSSFIRGISWRATHRWELWTVSSVSPDWSTWRSAGLRPLRHRPDGGAQRHRDRRRDLRPELHRPQRGGAVRRSGGVLRSGPGDAVRYEDMGLLSVSEK